MRKLSVVVATAAVLVLGACSAQNPAGPDPAGSLSQDLAGASAVTSGCPDNW
jgi:hypothetical protein